MDQPVSALAPPSATVRFRCNICGSDCECPRDRLDRATASCEGCGSTLRMRSIIGLLTRELFGELRPLGELPVRKDIRGVGLSDQLGYASRLGDLVDYTNTFYHQNPRLDITRVGDDLAGTCDFVLCSEVFEHVLPPVSRAFEGARRLLKPGGLLVMTVPYALEFSHTREHFPDLYKWCLEGDKFTGFRLRNLRRDGVEEVFDDLVFHGGPGSTLEMRLFSRDSLLAELRAAGFTDVRIADEDLPEIGVHWPCNWSLPVVARAGVVVQRGAREFVLQEDGEAELDARADLSPRWQQLAHAPELTRAHLLIAGETLRTPWMEAEADTEAGLTLARGLPEISDDGLTAELWLRKEAGGECKLVSWTLENHTPGIGEAGLVVPLPLQEGERFRLELRCGPGPLGSGNKDWLAVLDWVVGRFDRLPLLRARSHAAWRMANELAHFAGAYDRDFYADRKIDAPSGAASMAGVRPLPKDAADIPAPDESAWIERLGDMPALPGENAFSYAHRMLQRLLPEPAPNFATRIRELQARRPGEPLRMLSLCAGLAAIERFLLEHAGVPVRLCLVDVNASMLERAGADMPPGVEVDRVLGSVSDIGPGLGEFDVINITSGLHHIVELERVLAAIAAMLAPGGEFWLIGEQVGRNGNRLWPDAAKAANEVFGRWSEDKRRNANTGQVDTRVPALDYSRGCFEGIRSQDIEAQLGRYFLPLDVHLRDCFLWRLVDSAYAGNFDLADPTDRALLQEAVRAEARHWLEGGRGTSLNGAWRAKRDLLHAPLPGA